MKYAGTKTSAFRRRAALFAVASLLFAAAASSFAIRAATARGDDVPCAAALPPAVRSSACPGGEDPPPRPEKSSFEEVLRAFEPQSVRIFVDGAAYPYAVCERGGGIFVSPADFFGFAVPGSAASGGDGGVSVSSPGFEFECSAGAPYMTVNGRCLYLKDGTLTEYGRLMCPLTELTRAAGLGVSFRDGDVFVDGGFSPLPSGDEFYDAEDLYWLSRIISCESMSEPLTGKIAVGNVVLNRVASGEFPQDVKGVVFDCRYGIVQFSPVSAGVIYNEPDEESVVAAKLCLEGVSVSDRILYFMNPRLADTTWISDTREAVVTIGNHTFYS